MEAFPWIVRVGGLPAEWMDRLGSEACMEDVRAVQQAADELAAALGALVEQLFSAIGGTGAATGSDRRYLLAVKRDAFNGRSLRAHHGRPDWQRLTAVAGSTAEWVLRSEERLEAAWQELDTNLGRQREAEIRDLGRLVGDPRFVRGVALASFTLAQQLPRLTALEPRLHGRREQRLVSSLLRYASRAALKPSPFSSLTPVGLALGCADPAAAPFRLIGSANWQERSRICLRRYLLDQYAEILARYPPFRQHLRVLLNDTVEPIGDDRYRFLRPDFWSYEPETRTLRLEKPALVKVRLRGPRVRHLLDEQVPVHRTYHQLLDDLAAALPQTSREAHRASVDTLLEIGFLRFLWPWATDDLDLEGRLLEALDALPADAALAPFKGHFRRLLDLMSDLPSVASPVAQIGDLRQTTAALMTSLAPLVGMDPAVETLAATPNHILEDILLVAAGPSSPAGEMASLSLARAREILQDVEPLARLSNLHSSQHDFMHALAAFGARRWPGRADVGLLDFFDATQALFQDYLHYEFVARDQRTLLVKCFDPLGLPVMEQLTAWRRAVADGSGDCLRRDAGEVCLDGLAMTRLLDAVPRPYASPRDFSAFVQPLDAAGERWMLNSLFEGAGRMSSRYTPVMDQAMNRLWTDFFARHGAFMQDGEEVELVDLFCPAGHTLNVHSPQTRRMVEIPGQSSNLAPDRLLRLKDLRVRLCGPLDFPRLTDANGRWLWPLHLGGLVFRYMPNLLKFMVMFGPGELNVCFPTSDRRQEEGVALFDRHRVGRVVYARRGWYFAMSPLRARFARLSGAPLFKAMNDWRQERGIPRRVYLLEPLNAGPRPQMKPQYIDFASPLMLDLLRSALDLGVEQLRLFEALPAPEELTSDGEGRRWAVEVQLDCFGVQGFVGARQAIARRDGSAAEDPR